MQKAFYVLTALVLTLGAPAGAKETPRPPKTAKPAAPAKKGKTAKDSVTSGLAADSAVKTQQDSAREAATTTVDLPNLQVDAAPVSGTPQAASDSVGASPTSPWLSGLLGAAIGAVLGALASRWWLKGNVPPARPESPAGPEPIDPVVQARRDGNRNLRIRLQEENAQLQTENDALRKEMHGDKTEIARLRTAGLATAPDVVPETTDTFTAALNAVAQEVAAPVADSPQPSAQPTSNAPARFYAPAPNVPYIEHRKLAAEPFPLMPVCLIVTDGPAGNLATYGFSPQADQARIIADGIRNLRTFFDFDLPPNDQYTRITTAAAGKLERVGERWEVREKARLTIS